MAIPEIKVLVVDDSAVVRQGFTAILSKHPGVAVTVAADPYIAFAKMGHDRPDVILLDLDLPRMDGFTFLRHIMRVDPIPVVVCSGLVGQGTEVAIRALEEGAVEVVAKPQLGVRDFLHESAAALIDVVRGAAAARVHRRDARPRSPSPPTKAIRASRAMAGGAFGNVVVALGASTGGTEALRLVLEAMPEDAPGIVIVQHMPERFTTAFAHRLNLSCRIDVREAVMGEHVQSGCALIAPGNRHLELQRQGDRYRVVLSDGPPVSRHRPSVDVLLRSVARAAGPRAVGGVLTGMGNDGAAGLLDLHRAGAATFAQDERTAVVFGMPKEAIACGAADEVLPLSVIPEAILRLARRLPRSPSVSR